MGVDPVSLAINAALMAANMAVTASQSIEGPRLSDTSVTTAAYGAPMNYFVGTRRFDGLSCIWAEPLREVKRESKTKGGKYNSYTYFGTFAILVADQPCDKVLKILFDRNVVYDATGTGPISAFGGADITSYMRIYLGTEDQEPDPRMQATIEAQFGAGFCPAYRGCTYIVFEDLPLEKIGNRLPQVTVIAATSGETAYPYEKIETPVDQPSRLWGMAYSSDYSRLIYGLNGDYTIIDVAARAVMISGAFPSPVYNTQRTFGIDRVGRIYAAGDEEVVGGDIHVFSADGLFEVSTISAAGLTLGGAACVVKALDSESAEFLGVYTQFPSTQTAYTNLLTSTLIVVETDDFTPSGILTTGFFVDNTSGAFWGAGAKHDLVITTTIAYLFPLSDGGAPGAGMITVTGLSAKAEPNVQAFMVGDNYLMTWGEELYLLDPAGAILASQTGLALDPYNLPKQVENLKPGVTSLWVNPTLGTTALELSLLDLSILRTETMTNWSADDVDGLIYDPINNALITAPQTDDELAWRYLDRATGSGVTLEDLIVNVATRCGLGSGDYDASDCDQIVEGYSWTQGQGDQILSPPLEVYDAEVRPHDFGLEFRKRGVASLGTVDRDDFVGGFSATLPADGSLPLSMTLTFADPTLDQQKNAATDRRSTEAVDTSREVTIDAATLVFDADNARQVVAGILRRKWYEGGPISLSLSRAYSRLEPGDAYTLDLGDIERTAKITRQEFAGDGKVNLEWVRSSPAIHVLTALPGAPADGILPGSVLVVSYTNGQVLDIPLIRDADEGLIVYLAAGPYNSTLAWPGAEFFRSADGVTFDDTLGTVGSAERATMGHATSVLPDALTTVWDMGSTLTVKLFDGTLTSTTQAAVLNGANRAVIGDEVIGFVTATLIGDKTYDLTGLLRGRRGTEWATADHATGERFVILAGLPETDMGASDVGDLIYTKPITNGGTSGFTQALTFEGRSLKPYSPAQLAANDNAGDLELTWTRRTRIGGDNVYGSTPPLGETTEEYVVRIFDGSDVLLRTYSGLTTPTATYTAADQTSDGNAGASWDVRQVSSVVGPGYAATASL